jgi:hypothetical protein
MLRFAWIYNRFSRKSLECRIGIRADGNVLHKPLFALSSQYSTFLSL